MHFALFLLSFVLLSPARDASAAARDGADSLGIKIGQMLMVGFRGTEAGDESAIARDLAVNRIGGVILFDYDVPAKSPLRNIVSPAQVRSLTGALQRRSAIPLFVAIDQEGGRVNRLKPKYGFPPSLSQRAVGRIDAIDSTTAAANRTARTLADAGLTLNFAPVLDLEANPSNPVIAKLERSFSADPALVAKHGRAMIDAFHARGIFCAVKHFPGHGSSAGDTHEGFVDVTESWTHRELEPFGTLIHEGRCDMVMTAHIVNRRLDPVYPSTLSARIITGLLRDSLGFQGVVVSDDLQMKAISEHFGFDEAIRLAVLAGVDILLFGNNAGVFDERVATKAAASLRALVASGAITGERINQSYRRIMALKARQ
jgi:beta-N-acetylhexosaminidase